ncbi:tripartite tricarboxylate transporter permease [Thalassospira xiamenensis]|uniref:tripartite tricarboxylate transporter permease n=1 Tax=Thalassospira xiamenensis TaxID=220697 RepID=UPI000C097042|nr:tripartite tricarboxylate transporter permease [Thalassospira xiamenensis]MAC32479.1 C4-dicarboxylate ABC transporter permease [Haliea sp.]MBR9782270.1 C4-dicarboxylate ABC transporter permease [Rhodospirillales bacterium]MBR9816742.1 C4-dicarboxylate ABC transporter permease [Rhodospirillales bacterium]
MDAILDAVGMIANIKVLFAIFAATFLGLIMGSLPGLTAAMAIALLIPLTFGMGPVMGIATLLGAFCGAIAGGAVPAVLLGIPGTPSSVATTLDGFPMARNGQAGKALGIVISSSFVGGILGAVLLILLSPPIASFALRFGPAEFFSLGIFGLVIIASVSGGSMLRGLFGGLIGLFLATIGADPMTGVLRFTGGQPDLITGINLLPALIGLFAVSQVMQDIIESVNEKAVAPITQNFTSARPPFRLLAKAWKIIASSTVIGVVVGAIPGAGGSISSFLSYEQARRMSKTPEKFGKGHHEGLIATETSNNATAGGALIPMLTLGVPGEVATAVLMGGLTIQGVRPGPALFNEQASIVYAIFIAFILANIAMFVLQLGGIRLFVRILKVPSHIMMPLILMFCVVGVFGVNGSYFELWLMFAFGVLGYFLNRFGFGTAPVILGLILGSLTESNLRRGMIVFDGDWSQFVLRPISATLLLLSLLFLGMIIYQNRRVPKGVDEPKSTLDTDKKEQTNE